MKMQKPEVILTRKRDFSDIINATFSFITQEIRLLGKVILLYSGIPLLILITLTVVFSMTVFSGFLELVQSGRGFNFTGSSILVILLIALMFAVSLLLLIGLTASYLAVYSEKGHGQFSANDVWKRFVSRMFKHIVLIILMTILFFVAYAIGILISIGLGIAAGGGFMSGLFVFFGVVALIVVPMFYLAVPFSLVHFPLYCENSGIIKSIKRTFYLISGHWWLSFGVIFILTIIVILLSFLFALPARIVTLTQGFITLDSDNISSSAPLMLLITSLLGGIGQYLLFPIVLIGSGIQYFNLREFKDNDELLQKISEILPE